MPNGRNRFVNSKKRKKREPERQERDTVSPCPLNLTEPEPEQPISRPTSSSSSAYKPVSRQFRHTFDTAPKPTPRRSTRSTKRIHSPSPISGQEAFETWPEEYRKNGLRKTERVCENSDRPDSAKVKVKDERDTSQTVDGGSPTECAIQPATPLYSNFDHNPRRARYQVSPDTDDGLPDASKSTEVVTTSPTPSPSRLPLASSDTAAPAPGAWSSPPPSLPISSPLTSPPLSQTSLWAVEGPAPLLIAPPKTPQSAPNPGPLRSASSTPTERDCGAVAAEAATPQPKTNSIPVEESFAELQAEAGIPEKEEEGLIGLKEVEEEGRRYSAESSPLTSIASQSDRKHSPHPSVIGTAIASRLQIAATPTITSTEFCRISPSAVDSDTYPVASETIYPDIAPDISTSATAISHPERSRPVRGRPDLPRVVLEPQSEPVTPFLLTPTEDTGPDLSLGSEPITEKVGTSIERQSASPLLTLQKGQVSEIPRAKRGRKEKGKRNSDNLASAPSRRQSARLSGLSTSAPHTAVTRSSPEPVVEEPEPFTLALPITQHDPSPIQIEDPPAVSSHEDPPSSPLSSASPSPEPTQPTAAEKYRNNLDLFSLHHPLPAKLSRHASVPLTLRFKRVARGISCAPSFPHLGPDRHLPVPAERTTETLSGVQEITKIDTRVIQEDTEARTKEVSVTATVQSPVLITDTSASFPDIPAQIDLAVSSDTSNLPPPRSDPPLTATVPGITITFPCSRSKRNRPPSLPSLVSDWKLVPKPSSPQSRTEIMSAKRQRTDIHPAPSAMSPAKRVPSPSSSLSSLSPVPDSPVKSTATPSVATIKLKLPGDDGTKGGSVGGTDQAKEEGQSAGLMENGELLSASKKGGTRGITRKSIATDPTPSTLPPERPAPKITLKLGGMRATASAESTTPAHSPPPSAIPTSFGASDIAGPSRSGAKNDRAEGNKDKISTEDDKQPPAKRRGTRNSTANSPVRSVEGQAPVVVEGKEGENVNISGPTALEDVIMRERHKVPDPPTPTSAPIAPVGKARPGRRPKRIVDSPEAELSPSAPRALTVLPESNPAAEPVSQPTPVPVPHQDPTPPVSAAPTPPGGTSPKVNEIAQEAAAIESQGKVGSSSQPQAEGREVEKGPNEKVKGDTKKSAVGKFKKKAGVPSVSSPGDSTETPKKASAPSTPSATPTTAAGSASAKSAKSAKPLPTTTTPKVTPLPKKTTASVAGSASKLGPKSSAGTPSTSTPIAASTSKPAAAPSSLLAATLSQLKQAPSSASKQDAHVKKGKKEMPKIQKVERFPIYVRTAKEEEEYAASAEQRAKERARREGYKKNALNLNFARDTYKLDSFDKHNRGIDVPGHMGIITSGMPVKILKHVFGQDAVPHGIKQAQEEAADAESARAEGREPDVWEDDDEDPEWPIRRDEDWLFDWKGVKPGTSGKGDTDEQR